MFLLSWHVHGPLSDAVSRSGSYRLSGFPWDGHRRAPHHRHWRHDGSERGGHDGTHTGHDGWDDDAERLHGERAVRRYDGHDPQDDGTTGCSDACRHGAGSGHVRHPAGAAGPMEHGSGTEASRAILVLCTEQLHFTASTVCFVLCYRQWLSRVVSFITHVAAEATFTRM